MNRGFLMLTSVTYVVKKLIDINFIDIQLIVMQNKAGGSILCLSCKCKLIESRKQVRYTSEY